VGSRKFTVKDRYLQLRSEGNFPYKLFWKIKIPLKVKIFLWLMLKNSILTKDNLLKRGWTGNAQCHLRCRMKQLTISCLAALVMCTFGLVRPPENAADLAGHLDQFVSSKPKQAGTLWMCGWSKSTKLTSPANFSTK
jgi:hypothetical protein